MPFTVDHLTEAHAFILTADNRMFQEMPDMEDVILPLFDVLAEPAFLIVDMRTIKLGLDAVTQSANDTRRDRPQLLNHPKLRELIVVTPDRLIQLAIQGMSSPIFGSIRIRVFASPELALDYCRSQVAERPRKAAQKKSG